MEDDKREREDLPAKTVGRNENPDRRAEGGGR